MELLALLMSYFKSYDYIVFPLIVALLAGYQFKEDKRSALVLWSLAIVYTVDAVLGSMVFNSASNFYKFNIAVNTVVMTILMFQKQLWKKVVTGLMCLFIILMNLYEHVNEYQTSMYPYINTIHSWYLEFLIVIILIKFKAPTKR